MQTLSTWEPGSRHECLDAGLVGLPPQGITVLVPTVCHTPTPDTWEPQSSRTGCGRGELPASG